MSEVDKNVQPKYQYQYTTPERVKGGDIPPSAMPTENDMVMPYVDTLAPAGKTTEPIPITAFNDPQLPYTEKGKRKIEFKTQETKKEGLKKWFTNDSYLGPLLISYGNILTLYQEIRVKDAFAKAKKETELYKLGIEKAETDEQIKLTEATKTRLQAVIDGVTGIGSLMQIGAMENARRQAVAEAKTKWETDITAQKNKVEQAEGTLGVNAGDDISKLPASPNKDAVEKERGKLREFEYKRDQEAQTNIQIANQKIMLQGDTFKSFVKGLIELGVAEKIEESGVYEKERGIIEAVMQFVRTAVDDYNKSIDNMNPAIEKIFNQMTSLAEAHARAHSMKG